MPEHRCIGKDRSARSALLNHGRNSLCYSNCSAPLLNSGTDAGRAPTDVEPSCFHTGGLPTAAHIAILLCTTLKLAAPASGF